jgi:formamidopyrimidine-DNA glycosylase
MPELPEVETVRRTLKKQILNEEFKEVYVYYPNIIEEPDVDSFKSRLKGQQIIDMDRKGKWLIFVLNDYLLLTHLRMEGKFFIRHHDDELGKHEHVAFLFKSGIELRYNDTRKFGRMYLLDKDIAFTKKPLNELGLEPWDDNLNSTYLLNKYKNKKLPIKTVILDQSIITGIGNIYADEILYKACINPLQPASSLNVNDCNNIIKYTRDILSKAIDLGGTTIRSYESSEGVHGRFQTNLECHNHEGDKCPKCGEIITKIRVGGRGTYFCPNCQKDKKLKKQKN